MTALAIEPNTPEWLEERKKHIGASDAPTIMGLTTSWRSPRELGREKLGITQKQDDDSNNYLKRGHVLEPLVKRLYIEETGNEIFTAPMYTHNQYEWMSATPDGWIIGRNLECILECKTANKFTKNDWVDIGDNGERHDIVPTKYYVQVQHQMAVTEQERVVVAVLFGSDDFLDLLVKIIESGTPLNDVINLTQDQIEFKIIEIKRDDEFIKKLIEIEKNFWSFIEQGELPADYRYITDSGILRAAKPEEEELLSDLKTSFLNKLIAEEEFERRVEEVKVSIGSDSGIYSETFGKITYKKSNPKKSISWKQLSEFLLDFLPIDDHEDLINRYSTCSEPQRRFSFPFKHWKRS